MAIADCIQNPMNVARSANGRQAGGMCIVRWCVSPSTEMEAIESREPISPLAPCTCVHISQLIFQCIKCPLPSIQWVLTNLLLRRIASHWGLCHNVVYVLCSVFCVLAGFCYLLLSSKVNRLFHGIFFCSHVHLIHRRVRWFWSGESKG